MDGIAELNNRYLGWINGYHCREYFYIIKKEHILDRLEIEWEYYDDEIKEYFGAESIEDVTIEDAKNWLLNHWKSGWNLSTDEGFGSWLYDLFEVDSIPIDANHANDIMDILDKIADGDGDMWEDDKRKIVKELQLAIGGN